MKKWIVLVLVVLFAMPVLADEIKKISAQNGDVVEFKETLSMKDTQGNDIEIYIGKPILYTQRMIDQQKTNAEAQLVKWQAILDKLNNIQEEMNR